MNFCTGRILVTRAATTREVDIVATISPRISFLFNNDTVVDSAMLDNSVFESVANGAAHRRHDNLRTLCE